MMPMTIDVILVHANDSLQSDTFHNYRAIGWLELLSTDMIASLNMLKVL